MSSCINYNYLHQHGKEKPIDEVPQTHWGRRWRWTLRQCLLLTRVLLASIVLVDSWLPSTKLLLDSLTFFLNNLRSELVITPQKSFALLNKKLLLSLNKRGLILRSTDTFLNRPIEILEYAMKNLEFLLPNQYNKFKKRNFGQDYTLTSSMQPYPRCHSPICCALATKSLTQGHWSTGSTIGTHSKYSTLKTIENDWVG